MALRTVETEEGAEISGEARRVEFPAAELGLEDGAALAAAGAMVAHCPARAPGRLQRDFAAEPAAPREARRLVVDALRAWGADEDAIDDAALIVSELASNAVIHTASPFSLSLLVRDGCARVAVADRRPPSPTILGGLVPRPMRGLGVIEAISRSWGVEGGPDGKAVWAELNL